MFSKVTEDIYYVGVNDHQIDLFEGQYVVPNGMAYNSYVVMDEKVVVFDTVDAHFKDEWLATWRRYWTAENRIILSFSTWSRIIPPISRLLRKYIRK